MNPRNVAKLLLPPIVLEVWKNIQNQERGAGLIGDYNSWDEAKHASTDYDSELNLEKTLITLLKGKNGEVIYERDSVRFNEVQYAWPLLAGLMWVAAQITKKKFRYIAEFINSDYLQSPRNCFLI
jgi:hypothetical protein